MSNKLISPVGNGVCRGICRTMEFPPRQKPASFNLEAILAKMQAATDGSLH